MMDSNRPYNRAGRDSTWNGVAIGAGAGMGMVGATHGVLAGMDRYRNRQITRNNAAGVISVGPNGPAGGRMPKGRLRSKAFGGRLGWRGAAAYAGAGLLGGAIGGFTDRMTD